MFRRRKASRRSHRRMDPSRFIMRPMKTRVSLLVLASVVTMGLVMAAATAMAERQAPQAGSDAAWREVADAWDAGHYPDALQRLQALLQSPAAADNLERAALLTGELFKTVELTPDG